MTLRRHLFISLVGICCESNAASDRLDAHMRRGEEGNNGGGVCKDRITLEIK